MSSYAGEAVRTVVRLVGPDGTLDDEVVVEGAPPVLRRPYLAFDRGWLEGEASSPLVLEAAVYHLEFYVPGSVQHPAQATYRRRIQFRRTGS